MTLQALTAQATDKDSFRHVADYGNFCLEFLNFVQNGLQAVIVSQNEHNYRFFQFREDGFFNVSRPMNTALMAGHTDFEALQNQFSYALRHIGDIRQDAQSRAAINRYVYTCQQAIGITLDALPAGMGNTARKINGDLFENFIRLLIAELGISVRSGVVKIPVLLDGVRQFDMTYQHDIILEHDGALCAIGSVKTSSKDRLDKIFVDKFLYNRLTDSQIPHFAVFLNDVQRKGKEPFYGINSTFLTGHFKGYTVKLNPLDGVYYCDLRPNMRTDPLLHQHIRSLDCLLTEDIWNFT